MGWMRWWGAMGGGGRIRFRLPCTTGDLTKLFQRRCTPYLRQQGVGLYLHQQQVDTSTAAGRAFLQMAGVFAEFERSIIVERINCGLARAVAEGKQLGRPRVSAKIEVDIRKMLKAGTGKLRIARELGVGVSTVQRIAAG